MSEEENKNLVRRYYEESFYQGRQDILHEFVSSDFIDHTPSPGMPPGIEGMKLIHSMVHNAFHDIHVDIDDLIAEGDKIVARFTVSGSHKGEFMGMSPTGKKTSIMEIRIYRIEGRKIVEHWGLLDQGTMMQQLGLSP